MCCKHIVCALCQLLNSWTIHFNMMMVVSGAWLQLQRGWNPSNPICLSLCLSHLCFNKESGLMRIWKICVCSLITFLCDCLNLISCRIYLYTKKKEMEIGNHNTLIKIFCVLFCFLCFEWLDIKDTWAALQQLRLKNGRKKRNNICLVPLSKQQLEKGHFAVSRHH